VARSADSTLNTFACPFADRCSCRVKFRIAATAFKIKLEAQGEHTAESHVQDKVSKFLSIQQSAALEQMVSTNPMVSATSCRRGLELLPDPAAHISPSKQRLVARAVSAARLRTLQPSFAWREIRGRRRESDSIILKNLSAYACGGAQSWWQASGVAPTGLRWSSIQGWSSFRMLLDANAIVARGARN
jgi:hypothetical protein